MRTLQLSEKRVDDLPKWLEKELDIGMEVQRQGGGFSIYIPRANEVPNVLMILKMKLTNDLTAFIMRI